MLIWNFEAILYRRTYERVLFFIFCFKLRITMEIIIVSPILGSNILYRFKLTVVKGFIVYSTVSRTNLRVRNGNVNSLQAQVKKVIPTSQANIAPLIYVN